MMIWARRRPLLIGICLLFLAIIAGPWTVARFESNLSLLILERHVSLTAISEPTALLLDNPVPSDPALERVRMGLVDAVATHPNDARARAWIGYIDLLMGHPALALNESTAERGVPQDSMMRFRYATILAANGRSDDSRAVWGSINAGNYFAKVGAGARDHEQLELAVTADWLALDVGGLTTAVKARIYRDLGAISLFKSNEPQRALEELLTADSLQPNDISTLELLAEASFDIGNTDEALQYALSALSLMAGQPMPMRFPEKFTLAASNSLLPPTNCRRRCG